MPGARCARSLACKIKKHTSIVTTVTPEQPGIPRAMVLTVSFVLFPVTGLVCHRRQRKYFRRLDASVGASEPHDFAVRVSTVRQRCLRVHRIPSRVRDDREPPPVGRDARFIVLIWVKRRKEYFCKWDWTGQIILIRLDNSPSAKLSVPNPAAARTMMPRGRAEYFNPPLLETCLDLLASAWQRVGCESQEENQQGRSGAT